MNTDIQLTQNETQKFVLALGIKHHEKVLLLWGDRTAEWHKDIVESMLKNDVSDIVVLGGGKLLCDSKNNTMYVWGTSSRYGEAPTEKVTRALKELYPNYSYSYREPNEE